MYQKHIQNPAALYFLLLFLLAGCSTNKYAATNKIYKNKAKTFAKTITSFPPESQFADSMDAGERSFIGSVNFGMRKPNFVVIHHTAQTSADKTVNTFISTKNETSAHYIIGRDGKVVQMVNDYLRANHAGLGRWGNDTDLNSSSIGIELDNSGTEPFSDVQINSLLVLLGTLKKKYNIPAANFIGHADLAPGRKVDPLNFPWKKLASKGFGLWYDQVLKLPPAEFDGLQALRIMGYDTRNPGAAINAFKIHFVQTDISTVFTLADKLILYNLYTKYF
jgi:N-acetylmuramoyl-L-alanine amidase